MSAPETFHWTVLQEAMNPTMTLSPYLSSDAKVAAQHLTLAHAFEFGTVWMCLTTRPTHWSAVQRTTLTRSEPPEPWERYDFTVDLPDDWPVRRIPGRLVSRVNVRVEVL